MKLPQVRVRLLLRSGALLVLAAGCGGSLTPSGGPVESAQTQSAAILALHVPRAQLYVESSLGTSIPEYVVPDPRNRPPKCQDALQGFIGSSSGIAVNAAHTLYVPNPNTGQILTFAPNCQGEGVTLSDPGGGPTAVAFDNNKRIAYASENNGDCVTVYERAATSPTRSLCNSALVGSCGVAVDPRGNVYASSINYRHYNDAIVVFPKGRQQGSRVLPITGFDYQPCGIAFDRRGNLLIFAFYGGVYIYAPPFKGPPTRHFRTKGFPEYGALDRSNRTLYLSSAGSTVDVYDYPKGTFEYSLNVGPSSRALGVSGAAVDPPSGT